MVLVFKRWWWARSGALKGAFWMILAGIFFAALGVSIRLSALELPILEVDFFAILLT